MKKESFDMILNGLSSKGAAIEEDYWDEFEIRLKKRMFNKFSWNRFNIYYLTVIGLSIVTVAIALITFLSSPQIQENTNNFKEILYSDSLKVQDQEEVPLKKTDIMLEDNNIINKKEGRTNNNSIQVSTSNVDIKMDAFIEDTLNNNTAKITQADTLNTSLQPVIIKRKSVVYISKRDTIINCDTVKVKKRK